jgi:hypothetical protein
LGLFLDVKREFDLTKMTLHPSKRPVRAKKRTIQLFLPENICSIE